MWILYSILGIALLGLLFVSIDRCNRPISTTKPNKTVIPSIEDIEETNLPSISLDTIEVNTSLDRPKLKKV